MDCEKPADDVMPSSEFYKKFIKGMAITIFVLTGIILVLAITEVCIKNFISGGMMFGVFGSMVGFVINLGIMIKADDYSSKRMRGMMISAAISSTILGLFVIGQIVRIVIISIVQPERGDKNDKSDYIAMGSVMVIELAFISVTFTLCAVMAAIFGHRGKCK